MTGPTFSSSRKLTPIPASGSAMSAKMMAASSSMRFSGMSVTVATRSGLRAISRKPCFSLSFLYSGR